MSNIFPRRIVFAGIGFLVCCHSALAASAQPVVAAIASQEGAAVVQARARQFDLRSAINARQYRVFVATPPNMEAGKRYPIVYVLDGNAYFAIAADTLTRQSTLGVVAPAIVVGIGYPTDDPRAVFPLRGFDLAPSVSRDPDLKGRGGGADAFLRVIEEEIMPLVEGRYPADPARRAIWGHSLGGLTALHSMLRKPGLFATYALSSPSIWWNDREVLANLTGFSERLRGRSPPLRVLILSAADEQYRGTDRERLAAANATRMVDNATELATTLAAMPATHIAVQRVVFADELHETVSPASLSRSLRFALPMEK